MLLAKPTLVVMWFPFSVLPDPIYFHRAFMKDAGLRFSSPSISTRFGFSVFLICKFSLLVELGTLIRVS